MCLFLPVKKAKKKNNKSLHLNKRSGTILIVTLWILTILTVLAVALGQRASLEVKLAEYQRDKLKAAELAKAAIERAILEKQNDPNGKVDTLSESWANNELIFKDFELGEGAFTVSYSFDTMGGEGEAEKTRLYGMEDEENKININKAEKTVLENLFGDYDNANEIATSILAWRGDPAISSDEQSGEDEYYEALDLPYSRKKEEFKSIVELLLVRHMSPDALYGEDKDGDGKISENEEGIAQYLTVYGEGAVNINTASEKVLSALIGGTFPEMTQEDVEDLVFKIVVYRRGIDGTYENWFSVDEHEDLVANDSFFTVYNGNREDLAKLQSLKNTGKLAVSSNTYTIHAQAEVNRARKSITATIEIDKDNPDQIIYLSWHRN